MGFYYNRCFLPPLSAHNPNDPCAANTLSVLFEMCSLFHNATSASRNAMKLVSDQHADIVRFNLGRQLRKKGDYEEAAEIYQQVKEVDFSIQCDFALSLFLGKYQLISFCETMRISSSVFLHNYS